MNELHQRRRQKALRKKAAAVGVGRLAQVDTGEVQKIEGIEDGALGAAAAVLHGAERGPAARVERDDLAVEHHGVDRLVAELGRQAREVVAEIEAAPRPKPHAPWVDERKRAIPVELRLPHPVRAVEYGITEPGLHRL